MLLWVPRLPYELPSIAVPPSLLYMDSGMHSISLSIHINPQGTQGKCVHSQLYLDVGQLEVRWEGAESVVSKTT